MNMNVIAGIITYNPDMDILAQNICQTLKQVYLLIVVDNSSENLSDIENACVSDKIILLKNDKNNGIAYALNQILEIAKEKQFSWALTLDQDSIIPDNYVENLLSITKENIGIVCPRVYDREKNMEDLEVEGTGIVGVEKCITSGCIVCVSAWEKVGKFDEFLFIDSVDFEFCNRIIQYGYKIYKNQDVILNHSLGIRKEIKRWGRVYSIVIHSPERMYYIVRNRMYCDYKRYGHVTLRAILSISRIFIRILFCEDQVVAKIRNLRKGIRDARIYCKTKMM